jgi:hypothetical protein
MRLFGTELHLICSRDRRQFQNFRKNSRSKKRVETLQMSIQYRRPKQNNSTYEKMAKMIIIVIAFITFHLSDITLHNNDPSALMKSWRRHQI